MPQSEKQRVCDAGHANTSGDTDLCKKHVTQREREREREPGIQQDVTKMNSWDLCLLGKDVLKK